MIERTSPRPSGKACSSSCRPTALRLEARTDEQLGQLEEAAALDRARVPDQLRAVGSLGNPPLGRVIGQESVDRLDPLPPRVGVALQWRPVPAPEVGSRDPQQVVAGADVGRRSATDDRGCALGHSVTIQATREGDATAHGRGLSSRWDPCIIPPFATEPAVGRSPGHRIGSVRPIELRRLVRVQRSSTCAFGDPCESC